MVKPFLNSGIKLNEAWGYIVDGISELDTRVFRLRSFELALSVCLKDPLYSNEFYIEQLQQCPIPPDPNAALRFEDYLAWTAVYEQIMREAGIVGLFNDDDYDFGAANEFFKEDE